MTDDKVRENKLRRMAHRRGYTLSKSRRRDPQALGYGMFHLVDSSTNEPVFADHGWGMPLGTVEEWLTGGAQRRPKDSPGKSPA